jgi:hypothetical protein
VSIFDPFVTGLSLYAEKVEHIKRNVAPLVLARRTILSRSGMTPAAFVLPASWDPGPNPDDVDPRLVDGATAPKATLYGTPLMWDPDERMGLFYEGKP